MSKHSDKKSLSVGYRNPPRHTRFKLGQSGNPKGRPKKDRPEPPDVVGILSEPVTVQKAGRPQKMSPFEASLRKLANRAINGKDVNAALAFLGLCEKYDVVMPPQAPQGSGVVVIVPRGWDSDEYLAMLDKHGPPPWPGERSGLPE